MLEEVYEGLPRLSVDCGIMEKAGGVLVFPGDFGWDDIGSWTALKKKFLYFNFLEEGINRGLSKYTFMASKVLIT